jgi:CBS-domain-containing membrane protein
MSTSRIQIKRFNKPRDIAIRGIAKGKGPNAKVRDVMTEDVEYCFEDQELDVVTVANIQVRRLPVLNQEKRLVGILSVGDLAAIEPGGKHAGNALHGISRPSGQHNQVAQHATRLSPEDAEDA